MKRTRDVTLAEINHETGEKKQALVMRTKCPTCDRCLEPQELSQHDDETACSETAGLISALMLLREKELKLSDEVQKELKCVMNQIVKLLQSKEIQLPTKENKSGEDTIAMIELTTVLRQTGLSLEYDLHTELSNILTRVLKVLHQNGTPLRNQDGSIYQNGEDDGEDEEEICQSGEDDDDEDEDEEES